VSLTRKILILDHDEQVSTVLDLKLKSAGYEVVSLTKSVDALAITKDFAPDLIISEMVLPELSGVDFLKRLKMNTETANIPFIFFSSSSNIEDKIVAHEMGAEAFFAKPVFIKVLLNRIKDFFEQKKYNQLLSPDEQTKEFFGSILNISLIDLLNIIGENKKSGTIEIASSSGDKGVIYFAQGKIIRAEKVGSETQSGEEIFNTLLGWLDGNFILNYKEISSTIGKNIEKPLNKLIVDAVTWISDFTEMMEDMPPMDSKLFCNFKNFIDNLSKLPDTIGDIIKHVPEDGVKTSDIIENAGTDKKKTAEHIKKLIELNVLEYEKSESEYISLEKPEWFSESQPLEQPAISQNIEDFDNLERAETISTPETSLKKEIDSKPDELLEEEIGSQPEDLSNISPVKAPDFTGSDFSQILKEDKKADIIDEIDEVKPAPEKISATKTFSPTPVKKEIDLSDLESVDDSNDELLELIEESKGKSKKFLYLTGSFIVILILISTFFLYKYYFDSSKKLKEKTEQVKIDVANKNAPKPAAELPKPAAPTPKKVTEEEISGELFKKSIDELSDMANKSFEKEEYREAIKIYKLLLFKIGGDSAKDSKIAWKVWQNLAISYYSSENYGDALIAIEKSLLINKSPESIDVLAAIFEDKKEIPKAVEALESAVKDKDYPANRKNEWKKEIIRLKKIKTGK